MPEVSEYDNEQDWMSTCVPAMIEEGREQDQAVAACLNIWAEEQESKARAAKYNENRDELGRFAPGGGGTSGGGEGAGDGDGNGGGGDSFSGDSSYEKDMFGGYEKSQGDSKVKIRPPNKTQGRDEWEMRAYKKGEQQVQRNHVSDKYKSEKAAHEASEEFFKNPGSFIHYQEALSLMREGELPPQTNKAVKVITKREGNEDHPARHYLVVEDPESPSTWHLRVMDADGRPDHGLMGAAWAALHQGYRGNRYEGPSKQDALAKLKRLYDSEGMELPGEKAADAVALLAELDALLADETKAATIRNRAKALLRDIIALLEEKTLPAALRKEIEDVRDALRKTWADLEGEAAKDGEEEGETKAGARHSAGDLELLRNIRKAAREIDGHARDLGAPDLDGDNPITIPLLPAKSADDVLVWYGGPVKAYGDGQIGGHLVRFSSPEDLDLTGDYFDAKTDFGPATRTRVYYGHGLDDQLRLKVLGENEADLGQDDVGVWIKHQLDMRDKYERAVYALAERGALGWSSGTAAHLVEREKAPSGKGQHIIRWPLGLDASLTPTPADPMNMAIPLKSLTLDLALPEVEPAGTTASAGGEAARVDIDSEIKSTGTESPTMEVTEMDETQAASIAKEAAEQAVKAFVEAQKQPGPNKAGYIGGVTDQADRALAGNPFKSFGEFLLAIAHGATDERLAPLKSADPLDENGYDVGGAMGPAFVGSMYNAKQVHRALKALKTASAPSGMGEVFDAGFLVGTDTAPGILARVYETGEILRRVDMTRIGAGSNSMTFNAEDETSRADGSRRGGIQAYWAAEAAQVTAKSPKFRQLELKLKKVMALCYATDELLADATALESWIMTNLPEELRFVVEDAVFNGTGAGMPVGLITSGALIPVAKETGQAADTVVTENLTKMWSRLWAPSRVRAAWYISQDVEPQLYQLELPVGTGGQLVYMPPGGLSASPYGTLFGRPVIVNEYCPKLGDLGDIILADLTQYQMIEKGGVEAASSIHVRFLYGENTFRFTYRCDGNSKWNSALTPKNASTSTVSPYVGLAAR